MPIPNINVSLYPGLRANNSVAPRVSTRSGMVDGARGGDVPATIVFQDNFDNQPEYAASSTLAQGGVTGWNSSRNGEVVWSPSNGFPQKHEGFYITGDDPDLVRSGAKSFVAWRESYDAGFNNFNSDGILSKIFDPGFDEVFVRFYIKFKAGWTKAGQSKLFRIASLEPGAPAYGFGTNAEYGNGPIVFWDYSSGTYGVRNFIAIRGAPNQTNYYMADPAPTQLPREIANGDMSCQFGSNVTDLNGDGIDDNPPYIGRSGNPLTGIDDHDEVYGNEWNKIEFYVKMNSSPGSQDGVLKQWINDQLVFRNEVMPWVGNTGPTGKKWNAVHLGGNDFFRSYPNEDQYEEPYAIDDVEIFDGLPEGYN